MSLIKNFFKKRKQDIHFAAAGPGRRLCDSSAPAAPSPRQEVSQPRMAPTESAQRAAAAAQARIEERNRPRQKSGSGGAMVAATKQELLNEKRQSEEAQRLANIYGEKQEKHIELSPHQKIGNVLFKCSLFEEDPPTLASYTEMETKIREFLLDNVEKELIHAGALCIYTFEKSSELRQACLDTLLKLMDNLLESPDNPKFRRIRLNNKIIQQRIVAVEGAVHFLTGVGFQKQRKKMDEAAEDEEDFLIVEGELTPDHLRECKEALLNADAIRPELHRNTTVFSTAGGNPNALSRVDLPPEFYRISSDELRKEQELRKQAVEQMGMLRTKAMRERETQRELRRYRYSLVRVRFPDGLILQGVFFSHDKVALLTDWILSSLALTYVPFRLCTPSGQKVNVDAEENSTLAELGLAPAAVINFEFDQEVLRDVLIGPGGKSGAAVVQYVNDDLLRNMKSL